MSENLRYPHIQHWDCEVVVSSSANSYTAQKFGIVAMWANNSIPRVIVKRIKHVFIKLGYKCSKQRCWWQSKMGRTQIPDNQGNGKQNAPISIHWNITQ